MKDDRVKPEQLEDEAQITHEDLEASQEFARRYFTPLLNALLNAKAEETALIGAQLTSECRSW